ncbi:hypothetical protein [Serratia sp. M24T3]|uniref:hypothetical protein n=1 Tax=Serratia sp. M24T3 TaxID=932213 RepID=UPI00025BAF4B|nr:hypothetical protein [Serratia sp. M24T3]EIC85342.1 hypothetical protein SPM24T3_07884 [Serratia sp. M24T3]
MPISIEAVKESTLIINENNSNTKNLNTLKFESVSNTLLELASQPNKKTLNDGAKGALPETSAFKNGPEDHQLRNRISIVECPKVLINDEKEKINDSFSETIRNATSATLIHKLKNSTLPETLSLDDNNKLRSLLTKYNPDTLTTSPLIDVQGKPVEIETTGQCWISDGMDDGKSLFYHS